MEPKPPSAPAKMLGISLRFDGADPNRTEIKLTLDGEPVQIGLVQGVNVSISLDAAGNTVPRVTLTFVPGPFVVEGLLPLVEAAGLPGPLTTCKPKPAAKNFSTFEAYRLARLNWCREAGVDNPSEAELARAWAESRETRVDVFGRREIPPPTIDDSIELDRSVESPKQPVPAAVGEFSRFADYLDAVRKHARVTGTIYNPLRVMEQWLERPARQTDPRPNPLEFANPDDFTAAVRHWAKAHSGACVPWRSELVAAWQLSRAGK